MGKIEESTMELGKIKDTLLEQDKKIIQNNEICQNLVKEINSTHILVEEIIAIVNNSTEQLKLKDEKIKIKKEQMQKLVNKTLPVLTTIRTYLNEISLEELTELK